MMNKSPKSPRKQVTLARFSRLYDIYSRDVSRYCDRLAANGAGDDAAQQVWAEVLELGLAETAGRKPIRHAVMQIAYRESMDTRRTRESRRAKQVTVCSLQELEYDPAANCHDADRDVNPLAQYAADAVKRAAAIEPRGAAGIVAIARGQRYDEIAADQGTSSNAVDHAVRRARKIAQRYLQTVGAAE